MALGEFDRIEKYFAPLAKGFEGAFGLQDDVAVLQPRDNFDLVLTQDGIVEDVHYLAGDPPDLIAQKLLRSNLSDLAAKGAKPIGYLLTCAWNASRPEDWVQSFAEGLERDQARFNIHLLGGDTVSTTGPQVFSVTAVGECPKGRIIRRCGAKPGDLVYLSGEIGSAHLGLRILTGRLNVTNGQGLVDRYRVPLPRLDLGQRLREFASSSLDVSDGLIADATHLATASEVRIAIDAGKVPISRLTRQLMDDGEVTLTDLLTGGDDYEILYTADRSHQEELDRLSKGCGCKISVIGEVSEGSGVLVVSKSGQEISLKTAGYDHFSG